MIRPALLAFSCAALGAIGCSSQPAEQPFAATAQATAPASSGQLRASSSGGAQAAVTVANGETDQGVSGAQVTISGRPFTSDGAGAFAAPEPVLPDAPVEITANGFMKRETLTRTDTRFTLWPDRSGFSSSFTQELVYHPGFVQDGKLSRPRAGVFISFSAEVDADAQAAMREAAALLTAASEGRIPFSVGPAPPGSPSILVKIDGSHSFFAQNPGAIAVAIVQIQGNFLGGPDGQLIFKDAGASRLKTLAAHELGHHYGLGHPTSQGAVMNPVIDSGRSDYTSSEKLAIKMMALRRPGNAFPDNDRAVVAASGERRTAVFVCWLR
jgi:hypothetical protein